MNNNAIPIFDSCTHPTINGSWIHDNQDAGITNLIKDMHKNNITKALAHGITNVGQYSLEHYSELIKPYKNFIYPIASITEEALQPSSADKFINQCISHGYAGIKLHPRLSGIDYNDRRMHDVLITAAQKQLPVMLCTYPYNKNGASFFGPIQDLTQFIELASPSPVILMHGGVTELMRFVEITRNHDNCVLDLSFTMCKYASSSLDLNIQYLFENFDQRICIGSDHPEISLRYFRERFEYLSQNISIEKKENIAYRNLGRIFGESNA